MRNAVALVSLCICALPQPALAQGSGGSIEVALLYSTHVDPVFGEASTHVAGDIDGMLEPAVSATSLGWRIGRVQEMDGDNAAIEVAGTLWRTSYPDFSDRRGNSYSSVRQTMVLVDIGVHYPLSWPVRPVATASVGGRFDDYSNEGDETTARPPARVFAGALGIGARWVPLSRLAVFAEVRAISSGSYYRDCPTEGAYYVCGSEHSETPIAKILSVGASFRIR